MTPLSSRHSPCLLILDLFTSVLSNQHYHAPCGLLLAAVGTQRRPPQTCFTDAPHWHRISAFRGLIDSFLLCSHDQCPGMLSIGPCAGFEPTISAGERPKTYALDRAATGTGFYTLRWFGTGAVHGSRPLYCNIFLLLSGSYGAVKVRPRIKWRKIFNGLTVVSFLNYLIYIHIKYQTHHIQGVPGGM
jgi:hypothetical protein